MKSYRQPNDTVSVDHSVLETIACAAAEGVPGVERLGYARGTLKRVLGREGSEDGLHLTIEDGKVTVDVSLVLNARANLREICLKVQEEISRTIQQYVGMEVSAVNVHVEDIVFESNS